MAAAKRFTLNCDIGEGYYRWNLGPDEELMALIDRANIACGFHAGDHQTMLRTVRMAIKHGVEIGAHPGLDDLKGFGRRYIEITEDEAYSSALYQIGALKAIVEAEGGKLSHVKPHGMLYFILRDKPNILRAFLKAQISLLGKDIPFFGLAETNQETLCKELGVPFVPEVFCDIDYSTEGTLLGVPQSREPTPELIAKKLTKMFESNETLNIEDQVLPLPVTKGTFTICMHSDMKTALQNISAAREVLNKYK